MSEPIVNTVKKNTKLFTLDLEKEFRALKPVPLDLKEFLFMELIVKEEHFRNALANYDWSVFKDRVVHLFCSVDTIIPTWAWMLPIPFLKDLASHIVVSQFPQTSFDPNIGSGDVAEGPAMDDLFRIVLDNFDWSSLKDRFVILKGCSDINVPAWVYSEATRRSMPFARKILFGEACSNVPVFKS